jgi:hypothetical protein
MKKTSSLLILISLFLFITKRVDGQEIICTAGSNDVSTIGQLSWTIGDLITDTYTSTSSILCQGFNQNFQIATDVEELTNVGFSVEAFPNPATNFLKLKVFNKKQGKMSLSLFDLTGKKLIQRSLETDDMEIPLTGLAPSVYLIKIFDNDREIKSLKIIKQ